MSKIQEAQRAIEDLPQGKEIRVRTESDKVIFLKAGRRAGIPVASRTAHEKEGTVYYIRLQSTELMDVQTVSSGVEMQWLTGRTPVSQRTGQELKSLSYVPGKHPEVPSDWYVYIPKFKMIFRLRDTASLFALGDNGAENPDRYFVDEEGTPIEAAENRRRMNLLPRPWDEEDELKTETQENHG